VVGELGDRLVEDLVDELDSGDRLLHQAAWVEVSSRCVLIVTVPTLVFVLDALIA
jgi:hypothetical protein